MNWHDGTVEKQLGILAVNSTTGQIDLDFAGVGYAGLQFIHPIGSKISTGLFRSLPNVVAPMLGQSYPVIIVFSRTSDESILNLAKKQAVRHMQVQIRRTITQRVETAMHSNVWAERQQDLCYSDMDIVVNAIFRNQRLLTGAGPNAEALGDGQSRVLIHKGTPPTPISDDSLQYIFASDVIVRDIPTLYH